MKRVLIGGFLSFIGSIWALAIVFIVNNNLVSIGWNPLLGRFLTTVIEMDLLFLFILSIVFVIMGITIMMIELFRKEN